jgi:hypothetical protein
MSHSGIPCDARRLDGQHHPSCDSGPAQDADHENSCAHYDGRGPDHQQFGPPQANKTGSFFTETIIAAPLAVARLSNTTISMVIFTTLLPTGVCSPENAVSRLFGGASSRGVSLSAVCGGPTTDDPILSVLSCLSLLAGERAGPVVSTSAPIPERWELMSASTRGPASAPQRSVSVSCAWRAKNIVTDV